MTTIIGRNSLTGTAAAVNTDAQIQLTKGTLAPTLPASQQLTEMHFGYGDVSGTGTCTIKAALYDITSGVSSAPKIPGTEVTFTFDNTALSGNQWVSITGLTVDLGAYSGKQIAVLSASPSANGAGVMVATSAGSTRSRASGAGTATPATFTEASTSTSVFALYAVTETVSTPVIADVNTTNSVQVGDTPVVSGSNFGATTGTMSYGGVAIGSTSWADTSITSAAVTRGDLNYGAHDWIVTHNDTTASPALSVTLAIEAGYQFVNLVSPITTLVEGEITSLCYGTTPACETGDQLRVPLLTDQGNAIDISAADGTFIITGAGSDTQTFTYEIWDANGDSGDKWSNVTVATINGVVVAGGSVVKNVLNSVLKSPIKNVLEG